jgi:hypothetical protein
MNRRSCFAGLAFAIFLGPAVAGVSAQSGTAPRDTHDFVVIGVREDATRAGEARGQSAGLRRFLMTDSRSKSDTYRLDGSEEQLANHVGHLVEIAGSISGPISPATSGANAPQSTLKVKSLIYLTPTCAK